MTNQKAYRLAWMRDQAHRLLDHPHVKLCTCCQDDVSVILEDPLTRHSVYLLDKIRVRCGYTTRRREE
jgi:hypothetical protein